MRVPKLKAERLKRELTQVELSYISGVPVSEISKLETGRMQRPFPSHAQRLAEALQLKVPELVQEDLQETWA